MFLPIQWTFWESDDSDTTVLDWKAEVSGEGEERRSTTLNSLVHPWEDQRDAVKRNYGKWITSSVMLLMCSLCQRCRGSPPSLFTCASESACVEVLLLRAAPVINEVEAKAALNFGRKRTAEERRLVLDLERCCDVRVCCQSKLWGNRDSSFTFPVNFVARSIEALNGPFGFGAFGTKEFRILIFKASRGERVDALQFSRAVTALR